MRSTGLAVLAVLALALISTDDVSFIALAVFLLAETVLTFTAFEVLVLTDLFFECENISFQNVTNRVLSLLFELFIVVANVNCRLWALLALAGRSTSSLVP